MAFTFRNTTGGNPGVNRKLTIAEADGNTLEAKNRITALEGQTGKQIDEIEFTGTALIVHYTDATTDGPFPMPVATMTPAGTWMNSTAYSYLDVVTVPRVGTFLVLANHTTPAAPEEFDPEAMADSDTPLYFQISSFVDVDYDIAFALIGELPVADGSTDLPGSLVGQYVSVRDFIIETPLSDARTYLDTVGVTDVVLNIEKNGTSIGTVTFGAGENTADIVFSADVTFTVGDRIALRLMSSDGSASDLSITLPAVRTDL